MSSRLISFHELYCEYDYFLTQPELSNPWVTDNTEIWDMERNWYVDYIQLDFRSVETIK